MGQLVEDGSFYAARCKGRCLIYAGRLKCFAVDGVVEDALGGS